MAPVNKSWVLKCMFCSVCSEGEELRRKLSAVKAKYRQERELHDHMFEHGLELEKLINETAAENKYLTGRVKEYKT